MNTRLIKYGSIILLLAGMYYGTRLYLKDKKKTPTGVISDKNSAMKKIIEFIPSVDVTNLSMLGTDYLIAWANALRVGDALFVLGEKKYNTQTGSSI